MALTLQNKQPDESRLYDFDFSGLMRTGETVASVTSVVATPVGLTVGANTFSGQTTQVRLSGGTGATEYTITCKVVTSASNILELEGRLCVENITPLSTDEQAALDELVIMVQANVCPTLDYSTAKSELRVILTKHQRASVWTLSTTYQLGVRVVPTAANRNGHRYRLLNYTTTATDQKSDVTEPSWSTSRDAQITDNHVVWIEDGWDWDGNLWDLNAAAREGWLAKAAKSTGRVDFETQSIGVSASQIYKQCIEQANKYQSAYCL